MPDLIRLPPGAKEVIDDMAPLTSRVTKEVVDRIQRRLHSLGIEEVSISQIRNRVQYLREKKGVVLYRRADVYKKEQAPERKYDPEAHRESRHYKGCFEL